MYVCVFLLNRDGIGTQQTKRNYRPVKSDEQLTNTALQLARIGATRLAIGATRPDLTH